MRVRRGAALAVGIGLLVSACAAPATPGGGDVSTGSDAPSAVAPDPSAAVAARAVLADRPVVSGGAFDVESVADSPVILWFWAPWCTICRAEAPEVAEVAAELEASGSPVVLLGIPGRGGLPGMEDFVSDTGTGAFTHVADLDGAVWREFGVLTQPAFAFLHADGEVHVHNGALGGRGLREAVAALETG